MSHLSLRAASEVGNRVAHRANNSLSNQNMATILVNRGKLDKAHAGGIDDEYLLDE